MKPNRSNDTENKEVYNMGTTTLGERYCTVEESMIESFKEVKLMREGKLPKRSWQDYMLEHGKQEEDK